MFLPTERCLEDHEIVVQVESTMPSESKFLFRKNYAKYEFFKNPVVSLLLGLTLWLLEFVLGLNTVLLSERGLTYNAIITRSH